MDLLWQGGGARPHAVYQAPMKCHFKKYPLVLSPRTLKCRVVARDRIRVYPASVKGRSDLYFPLHALLARLPEVPVHGIPTIQRAVINRQTAGTYQLFAEGTDLRVRECAHCGGTIFSCAWGAPVHCSVLLLAMAATDRGFRKCI